MKKLGSIRFLAIAGAFAFAAVQSRADVVLTLTTSSILGDGVSGKATLDFSGTTLTITLENDSAAGHIDQVLDGFNFSVTGGTLGTGLDITKETGFVSCSGGTCTESSTNSGTEPFGWTAASGGGNSYHVDAGAGSFKPYGILPNVTYPTSPNCGGGGGGDLCNSQHNIYLDGPVTMTLPFTPSGPGATIVVGAVTFDWGTSPNTGDGTLTTGSCGRDVCSGTLTSTPEPTSIVLFGTVALGTCFALRRRFAK